MAEENRKREEAVQELKNKNINISEKYKTHSGTINTIRNEQSNFERVIKDKRFVFLDKNLFSTFLLLFPNKKCLI